MTKPVLVELEGRGVLAISGEDRVAFLQGLVSNDVEQAGPGRAVYSAFLTPQGKFLNDFFIASDGERLLRLTASWPAGGFAKKLRIYKLRSKVELADVSREFKVLAAFGDGALAAMGSPPEAGAGRTFWMASPSLTPACRHGSPSSLPVDADTTALDMAAASMADYDAHRISLGIPDSALDMEVEKTVLLEAGFDELNGVDWKKGCYMGRGTDGAHQVPGPGQATAAADHRRWALPPPGTPITLDGREPERSARSRAARPSRCCASTCWRRGRAPCARAM